MSSNSILRIFIRFYTWFLFELLIKNCHGYINVGNTYILEFQPEVDIADERLIESLNVIYY